MTADPAGGELRDPDFGRMLDGFRQAGPLLQEKRYEWLSRAVREAVRDGGLPEGTMLPTEADLMKQFGLSRQTVRKAMDQLVQQDLITRVAGKGTFLNPERGPRFRQFSSSQDLLSSTQDAEHEMVIPMHNRIDLAAAGRLQLPTDIVACASFRRIKDGQAFGYTSVYMPPKIGDLLRDVLELQESAIATRTTLVELLDERLPGGILSAEQSITAAGLPLEAAQSLNRQEGDISLRIDLAYFGKSGTMVELQSSYFLPESYSHRSKYVRRR